MTPTFMAKAKSRMTPVPKMFIARVTKNTVALVKMVRDSVSLIDWLTILSKRAVAVACAAFSRMRSNTTMVSFIEKPMMVSSAATVVSENSL